MLGIKKTKINPDNGLQIVAQSANSSDVESDITSSGAEEKSWMKSGHSKHELSQSGSKRTSQSDSKTKISKRTGNSDLILREYTGIFKILCFLPQTLIKITFRLPICLKLCCMTLIPIIILILVGAGFLIYIINDLIVTQHSLNLMFILDSVRKTSMAVNWERGQIFRQIIVGGDTTNRALAFADTDKTLLNLETTLSDFTTSSMSLSTHILNCRNISTTISNIRQNALLSSNLDTIFQNYNQQVIILNSAIESILFDPNFYTLEKFGHLKNQLLKFITWTGDIRDLMSQNLYLGKFSTQESYNKFIELHSNRNAIYKQFMDGIVNYVNAESEVFVPYTTFGLEYIPSYSFFENNNTKFKNLIYNETLSDSPVSYFDDAQNVFSFTITFSNMNDDIVNKVAFDKKKSSEDTIIIESTLIIAGIVLSIISVMICAYCIYKPWRVMTRAREKNLASAIQLADAIVRLDPKVINQKSFEQNDDSLSPLEVALKKIAVKFSIFLPYLPQSVIASSREVNNITQKNNATYLKGSPTPYSEPNIRRTKRALHSETTQSYRDGRSSNVAAKSSFEYKDISVLLIDIKDTHDLLEGFSSMDIIDGIADLLNYVYDIVNIHNGVIEIMHDKFIITFNAVTSSISPEKQACATAIAIADVLETKLIPEWKKHELPPLQLNMAIVSGPAFVGGIGNNYIRSFATFAPMLTKLWKLIKLNNSYETDHNILIDDATAKKVDLHFTTKIIDVIHFKEIKKNKPEIMFSLVNQHNVKSDEWMYEYSELENKKEIGKEDLLEAWRLMIRGEIEESWKKLYSYNKLISDNDELKELNKASITRLESYLKMKEADQVKQET